ncbi:MAG: hypothetical protein J1F39_00650 [Clostridiales bacterium]|nr:hypothetical protein [Clostridiales bacterium]
MRRSYIISDSLYRLTHAFKRNKVTVGIYALFAAVFIVIGIVIGVNMEDKSAYALNNGAVIFKFLRGDTGAFAFFFTDFLLNTVYAAFAAIVIYPRFLWVISVAPMLYKSYSLGASVCVIVFVYSASALPMLFVLFVPMCIIEIAVFSALSFRSKCFSLEFGRGAPCKPDIKYYAKKTLPYIAVLVVCSIIKTVTVVLFGSALIGII